MDLRSRDVRHPVLRALDAHMASHHGVIDRATAIGLGASRHLVQERVASGAWQELYGRVYRAAAAPRSPEQDLFAAVLACGPGAVASHRSAAWMWRLLARPPAMPEVTVPLGRTPRPPGVAVYRSRDIAGTAPSLRKGIPLTGPARAILDVAGRVSPDITALMIDRAIASKLLTVPALVAAVEQFGRRGRPGIRALRLALQERGAAAPGHAPTVLESAMARVLKRMSVAPPIPEYRAARNIRFDFAWPEILFALEVLGWIGHSAHPDWARNIAKRNWAGKNGWEVLEVTWDDLKQRPEWVAREIEERMSRRTLRLPEL